jgi:hypothetical protein
MPCAKCAYVPYYTKYQNQNYQLPHTKRWEAVHQKDKAQITTRAKFKCSCVKVALLRHKKTFLTQIQNQNYSSGTNA